MRLELRRKFQKLPRYKKIMCEDCKKEVVAFSGYSPTQIASKNKATYGKILCAACSSKLKLEDKKDENN